MPVRPNLLERVFLFRMNRGPAAVLDLFGAGTFHAVALAHDLGLFEALDQPWTLEELCDDLGAHPDGLAPLLELLVATGYLDTKNDHFRRTASTERWLTEDGRANLGPWFVFWRDVVFPFWRDHLETTVREGRPPQTIYEWLDEHPDRWPTAQRGFRAAATVLAEPVADALTVPDGPARILDVGGGHGLYAATLLERGPERRAVVFDDPAALDVANKEAVARGLGDRLRTRAGDYTTDDLGEDWDLALLFNVTHAHDGATVRGLFERVRDALAPGGRVAVLDQFAGSGRTPVGRAGLAFVSLTYQATLGQSIHGADEVAEWLATAGFADVERTPIRTAGPGNVLLEARRS